MPMWEAAPAFAPTTLLSALGLGPAMAASLGLFGSVALASVVVERRRHGTLEQKQTPSSILHGPWPLVAGALGLAAINVATLLLAGRPWGVTSAFALWGSKIAEVAGVDVGSVAVLAVAGARGGTAGQRAQGRHVRDGLRDHARRAHRCRPRGPVRAVVARADALAGGGDAGGLMLGYGARIAYGCNIGAYFSGIASSSIHGWVWFAAAFAGNMLGTRLRPWFGLRV